MGEEELIREGSEKGDIVRARRKESVVRKKEVAGGTIPA